MYKYKHYYILEKCLCYSPGPTELLQRSGDLGLRRSSGKGKSLMLLASNNKSWSYFPPCLIKYFEKKTWLIDLPRPLIHYWFGTVKGPPQHYLLNGHKEPWNKWSTFTSLLCWSILLIVFTFSSQKKSYKPSHASHTSCKMIHSNIKICQTWIFHIYDMECLKCLLNWQMTCHCNKTRSHNQPTNQSSLEAYIWSLPTALSLPFEHGGMSQPWTAATCLWTSNRKT